ncbi:MAG: helix-hairpin-helix domain-containing protein [Prevotella sp.]|nr:helix-hairpin-helix domain-containing protein [Prevotella sp.]
MNHNDRLVLIAAVIVGVLALVGIYWVGAPSHIPQKGEERKDRYVPYAATESQHTVEEFPFDPNTADSSQLLRLGLQPWQVRNIYRYRAKGGIYRKKEDFARLYGLTVKDYRRLEPYIHISADYQPASTLFKNSAPSLPGRGKKDSPSHASPFPPHYKIREGEHVVLNTADTAMLQKVPGIGPYYAKEIARYGRRLGGYVNVDQLDEIDQFPQSAKKYFVIAQAAPRKLNVNKLTLEQLRRHPYINYYQAKAITDYRRLYGPIKSLKDLRLSTDFTDADIRRLEPYVEY